MAATIADMSIIPSWKSHSLRCGDLFWQPAGVLSTLRSLAIVQHRRRAVSGDAHRIQCSDRRPDRDLLQGGAVSQERSRLFHSAKTRLSLVLGLLMLAFGLLKVVNPTIDGWFRVQIQQSPLPHSALLTPPIPDLAPALPSLL